VRFYDGPLVVKVHLRQPPGGRATDVADFPAHKTAYALRDVTALEREATRHGPAIGAYAHALLAVPLPWTRMRRVYALLGLVKRYGAARVAELCERALAVDLVDVTRLKRMLALAAPPPPPAAAPAALPLARYLRPCTDYTLARPTPEPPHDA